MDSSRFDRLVPSIAPTTPSAFLDAPRPINPTFRGDARRPRKRTDAASLRRNATRSRYTREKCAFDRSRARIDRRPATIDDFGTPGTLAYARNAISRKKDARSNGAIARSATSRSAAPVLRLRTKAGSREKGRELIASYWARGRLAANHAIAFRRERLARTIRHGGRETITTIARRCLRRCYGSIRRNFEACFSITGERTRALRLRARRVGLIQLDFLTRAPARCGPSTPIVRYALRFTSTLLRHYCARFLCVYLVKVTTIKVSRDVRTRPLRVIVRHDRTVASNIRSPGVSVLRYDC